jgi:hypothetical protein
MNCAFKQFKFNLKKEAKIMAKEIERKWVVEGAPRREDDMNG